MTACNFCDSTESRLLLRGRGFDRGSEMFDLRECARCGLVWVDPPLTSEQLGRYYSMAYYGGSQSKFNPLVEKLTQLAAGSRARHIARHRPGGGRVLDIGCGRGTFLRAMHRLGYEAVGTELSGFPLPENTPGLSFVHSHAESLPFGEDEFDAISIWHVLEHTTDPAAVIRGIARSLKPGGVLSLAVPHFGSTQAGIFGGDWFHLDLPRHQYHFRLQPLQEMLARNGLNPLEIRTLSWEQNAYGFIQSALNRIFSQRDPNAFYRALKRGSSGAARFTTLLGHGCLAAALAPFALTESVVSALRGRGATLMLLARKADRTPIDAKSMVTSSAAEYGGECLPRP
jgi:2-polyprenyl-3-methyl-5-hydroxy-6-metoxy-1,4-benzoquinol methylase